MATASALCFLLLSGALSARAFCPDRCDCQHAQRLLCANRGLRAVPKAAAARASGDVLVLSLGGNFIGNVTAFDLSRFGRLTRLDLQYNQIRAVHPKAFEKQSRLEELYLGNNLLTGISAGTLQPLRKLRVLDANSNEIERLAPDGFAGLGSVIKLRLDGNSIRTLPGSAFKGMESLLYLHLESNGLERLHADAFAGLGRLRLLNLSDNLQTALEPRTFAPLASLTTLLLARNRIGRLGDGVFRNLAGLTRLSLSANNISALERRALAGLGSVRQLLLDRNRLSAVPEGLLDPLGALEELDLSGNLLTRLHPAAFRRLRRLAALRLEGNRLSSLPGDAFAANAGLRRLGLGANAWACDCGLAGFGRWLRRARSRGRSLSARLRCRRPAALAGRYLGYLSGSELRAANGNRTCASGPAGGAAPGAGEGEEEEEEEEEEEVQADQGQPGQPQRRKGGAPGGAEPRRGRVRADPPTAPPPGGALTARRPRQERPLGAEACLFNSRFLLNVSAERSGPTAAEVRWELRPPAPGAPPPPPPASLQFRVRYDRFGAPARFPRFLYVGGAARRVTLRELAAGRPYAACVEGVVGGASCEVASRDHCADVAEGKEPGGGAADLRLVTAAALVLNGALLLAVGGAWAGRALRRRLHRGKASAGVRRMYSARQPLRTMATEAVSADFAAYRSGRARLGGADPGDLIQFPGDRFPGDRFLDGDTACRDDAMQRFQD